MFTKHIKLIFFKYNVSKKYVKKYWVSVIVYQLMMIPNKIWIHMVFVSKNRLYELISLDKKKSDVWTGGHLLL